MIDNDVEPLRNRCMTAGGPACRTKCKADRGYPAPPQAPCLSRFLSAGATGDAAAGLSLTTLNVHARKGILEGWLPTTCLDFWKQGMGRNDWRRLKSSFLKNGSMPTWLTPMKALAVKTQQASVPPFNSSERATGALRVVRRSLMQKYDGKWAGLKMRTLGLGACAVYVVTCDVGMTMSGRLRSLWCSKNTAA